MDLGAEEETVVELGDQMASHGHMCYQGWQDNALTLGNETDKLIMGGAFLVLPTVLSTLKS